MVCHLFCEGEEKEKKKFGKGVEDLSDKMCLLWGRQMADSRLDDQNFGH